MEIKDRLATSIGNIHMKNPLMTASGTSGHSDELTQISQIDITSIGAFVTKGITLNKREGNPTIRIVETRSGIINSIGLQNSGVFYFLKEELPKLKNYKIPIIINISADSVEQFGELCRKIAESENVGLISGIEINLSCPNVSSGGINFGIDPKIVERVVKTVKKEIQNKTIITKLTPNVTDITTIARAAILGGTDALCMINTLRAMAIDIEHKKPYLGNRTGGLSGPAIKPIGVFMVYECFCKISECRSKKIPIIGVGGIIDYRDALEYIMAGANAVEIGTGFFINPHIFKIIGEQIEKYLTEHNMIIRDIIGIAAE